MTVEKCKIKTLASKDFFKNYKYKTVCGLQKSITIYIFIFLHACDLQ